MKLTVLGARGSMPVSGRQYMTYGSATSCYLIETETEAVYFDAGSGIVNTPNFKDKRISIFLSHPHLDHLLGLPFCPMLSERDRNIVLYGMEKDSLSVRDQVDHVFSQPAWPLHLVNYPANLKYMGLKDKDRIILSGLSISWERGNHPGDCLILKAEENGKSIVYATDYEHEKEADERLISFASGADILIYDSQYDEEEYESKRGYGHSTPEHGIGIFEKCKAKKLLFTHHDPFADDETLNAAGKRYASMNPDVLFASEGDIFTV